MLDPVTIPYGPHPAQFVEHWPPAPGSDDRQHGQGRAVLIHGGYWRNRYSLDLMHPMARHLQRRGWAVSNLEYRRIGDVDDPAEVWPAMAADILTGATISSGPAPPPGPTVVIGHSAGGHLALWLAASTDTASTDTATDIATDVAIATDVDVDVDAVVALAPVADLAEAERLDLSDGAARLLLDGTPATRADRYRAASPTERLPLGVPQLIVHGTADDAVPIEIGDAYVSRARSAGDAVEHHRPDGVDHFHIIDPEHPCWRPIDGWLDAQGAERGPTRA